ncbi:Zn-dependent alcohol dehydrogenase [Yinghuangia seranimata]|uniref:Zn-dependent alcohol dehydrogenase n=1 Tax=Yinghuangia seranimata TaxID=408067 RepID=UPI00248C4987|nr:Zn-dependent alcohol dehydrogenase [Yinghuangia seranimata]MDI2128577.1 Zn-dependent alcohol dehydrogenase [Yinghuangia seranimata]
MRAAILHETGQDKLEVRDDVEAVGMGPGRVRVKLHVTGVCHSDLSAMTGVLPQPAPFVPGHEGAGEVVEVGDGVTSVAVGDKVVICWAPPCGVCNYCTGGQSNLCLSGFMNAGTQNFTYGGTPAFGFTGTGTFAEEVVVAAPCAIKVPDDVPYEVASLIGCGVTTGVGAVFNSARIEPGASTAVIGAGGVGIAVIQALRAAGAADIVAIDPATSKHEWAKKFGATHAITPDEAQAAKNDLTAGQGFDYVFEVVGKSFTARSAYELTRRGGNTVIVGAGAMDDNVQFNMFELFFDQKQIIGSIYGGGDIVREYNRIIRMWRAGRLDLEAMITHRLDLADINDAFDLMKSGESIRTIVTLA